MITLYIEIFYTPEELKERLSEEQRSNLLTLAKYLLSKKKKPAEFNMKHFNEYQMVGKDGWAATECGSVGCAVGHGPYAGIRKSSEENWVDYADRSFCGGSDFIFDYLFSGAWYTIDNTAEGAGKRILFMLKFGCPKKYNDTSYQKFSIKQLR